MSLPIRERRRIAVATGLSLGYLQKHTYSSRGEPKFHFANAVLLDKASGGLLSFLVHTEGEVDWAFVLKRLRSARRRGLL